MSPQREDHFKPEALRDLIVRLDRSAASAAQQLRSARDATMARTCLTLALRAEALLLAHILGRPTAELADWAQRLASAFVQLEHAATRSRLAMADRAAITMGRALAVQVNGAIAMGKGVHAWTPF